MIRMEDGLINQEKRSFQKNSSLKKQSYYLFPLLIISRLEWLPKDYDVRCLVKRKAGRPGKDDPLVVS